MAKDISRFMSYIEKKGDCWLWKGATDCKGYSIFYYKGKAQFGHRVSLLLFNKDEHFKLTPGKIVCHSCKNKNCVNPDHLREDTLKSNSKDKHKDGTAQTGDKCHFAKLNWDLISEIRSSKMEASEMARKYRVSVQTIRRVLQGESWISQPEIPPLPNLQISFSQLHLYAF